MKRVFIWFSLRLSKYSATPVVVFQGCRTGRLLLGGQAAADAAALA